MHERLELVFDSLVEANIIKHVRDVERAYGDSRLISVWSVKSPHYEYIQNLLESRDDTTPPALPCGDHGFINEGDAIACKFDDCDSVWSKEELRHFWEHGELPSEIPERVICDACGGNAKRLRCSGEKFEGVTMHYFSCQDCTEGGHIQTDGDDDRRVGPVFDADRYNAHGGAEVVLSD